MKDPVTKGIEKRIDKIIYNVFAEGDRLHVVTNGSPIVGGRVELTIQLDDAEAYEALWQGTDVDKELVCTWLEHHFPWRLKPPVPWKIKGTL